MHSDFVISQTDGRPMYLQIIEQIKQKVGVGEWAPGSEIPSIRQLAVSLRVSVITIKRAYLELEREGVIVTQQGKGSVIAFDAALGNRLNDQDLNNHIDQIVRIGALLSLAPEQLVARVREAAERQAADRELKARELKDLELKDQPGNDSPKRSVVRAD